MKATEEDGEEEEMMRSHRGDLFHGRSEEACEISRAHLITERERERFWGGEWR